MCLLIAFSLLVKQELQNKGSRFDILSTAMQLMDDSDSNSRIIDLTGNDQLVAEYVDLSKDAEVVDLYSRNSSVSLLCSSSDLLSSNHSKLMSHALVQDSDTSIDSDNSSSGTGGKAGLAHPLLIGTLVRFKKKKSEEEKNFAKQVEHPEQLHSVPFFLLGEDHLREFCLLHPEHPDCSMEKSTVTPINTAFNTTKWRN